MSVFPNRTLRSEARRGTVSGAGGGGEGAEGAGAGESGSHIAAARGSERARGCERASRGGGGGGHVTSRTRSPEKFRSTGDRRGSWRAADGLLLGNRLALDCGRPGLPSADSDTPRRASTARADRPNMNSAEILCRPIAATVSARRCARNHPRARSPRAPRGLAVDARNPEGYRPERVPYPVVACRSLTPARLPLRAFPPLHASPPDPPQPLARPPPRRRRARDRDLHVRRVRRRARRGPLPQDDARRVRARGHHLVRVPDATHAHHVRGRVRPRVPRRERRQGGGPPVPHRGGRHGETQDGAGGDAQGGAREGRRASCPRARRRAALRGEPVMRRANERARDEGPPDRGGAVPRGFRGAWRARFLSSIQVLSSIPRARVPSYGGGSIDRESLPAPKGKKIPSRRFAQRVQRQSFERTARIVRRRSRCSRFGFSRTWHSRRMMDDAGLVSFIVYETRRRSSFPASDLPCSARAGRPPRRPPAYGRARDGPLHRARGA